MSIPQAWRDLLYPGEATDFFTRTSFPPFEPDAKGFSRANALWLAEFSRLIYRHDLKEGPPFQIPSLDDFLVRIGFTKQFFFQSRKKDTQAVLAYTAKPIEFAVLAFRGTEQTSGDFETDLKLWKNFLAFAKSTLRSPSQSQAWVHAGFREALDAIWPEVKNQLAQLPPGCPVFFTGHSLGAALATLAAARHTPQAVYTFGSPRVGNRAFVDQLAGIPIFRVIDDKDIVTQLPPEKIWFRKTGFVHAGEEHRIGVSQSSVQAPILNIWEVPPKSFLDHAPVCYVSRL